MSMSLRFVVMGSRLGGLPPHLDNPVGAQSDALLAWAALAVRVSMSFWWLTWLSGSSGLPP